MGFFSRLFGKKETIAVESEDADEQFKLGLAYANQGNHEVAAKWYVKAAEQGSVSAQACLGALYASGVGVRQDTTKAIELLTKAAEQGHMDAQFNLGVIHTKRREYKRAFELYLPIAELGHSNAQNMVGEMYFNGDWVNQDFEQAA